MNATITLADRKDRLILERIHDPYKAKRKLPEPTVCPGCQAVLREGRWQWAKSWPESSHRELCQACHAFGADRGVVEADSFKAR